MNMLHQIKVHEEYQTHLMPQNGRLLFSLIAPRTSSSYKATSIGTNGLGTVARIPDEWRGYSRRSPCGKTSTLPVCVGLDDFVAVSIHSGPSQTTFLARSNTINS
jgi:hypothetical protein